MTRLPARLGDLCTIQSGGTPRRGVVGYYGGAIPWAKIGDLNATDGVVRETEETITEEGLRSIGDRIFAEGTILLAMYGSVGKVAVAGRPLATNQAILGISPRDPAAFNARFLRHWLQASQSRLINAARGVTQANISKTIVEALVVPLLTPKEQCRIADILDKADTIRRKRKEAIALTEELLHSTFLEIVGPSARDYGRWERRPIETLAAVQANAMRTGPFGSDLRHSEFVSEGIAVLGIDNAVQNRFAWGERRYITPEKYERLRRYTVHPGDVIVTIMGTTGRSAVVPDDIPPAITTKHLATITLDRTRADPEFVSQALFRHPDLLDQIRAANRGAIMSGLNLGLIKALKVPLPPVARQREFARFTAEVRTMAVGLETARAAADAMFASLTASSFGNRGLHRQENPC